MHSIAKAFSKERDRECPTCQGARRIFIDDRYVECYHCGGKGFLRLAE